jgi:hypothetical protein
VVRQILKAVQLGLSPGRLLRCSENQAQGFSGRNRSKGENVMPTGGSDFHGAFHMLLTRSKVLREATARSDARIITRAKSPREILGPAVNLLTAGVMRTSVWPAGAL